MAVQRNWNYYTYESDDGTTYNIRATVEWAAVGAHGLAARTSGAPRYIASKQQQPRKVIYQDATTGRTTSGPVGTAAAYAALDLGDTSSVIVPGNVSGVTYDLVKKVGERVPRSIVGPQLADHT